MSAKRMKYAFVVVASLFASVGLVWAASLMVSCGNWSTVWLCRVSERVGGAVLAPGIMAGLYSGSKLFALLSDTLFYTVILSLIFCLSMERRSKLDQDDSPSGQ